MLHWFTVAATKNFTLSIPEELLQKLRVHAAKRNESMTAVINDAIREKVEQDDDYEAAKRRILERLENPFDLGTNGRIPWTREELHRRGVH